MRFLGNRSTGWWTGRPVRSVRKFQELIVDMAFGLVSINRHTHKFQCWCSPRILSPITPSLSLKLSLSLLKSVLSVRTLFISHSWETKIDFVLSRGLCLEIPPSHLIINLKSYSWLHVVAAVRSWEDFSLGFCFGNSSNTTETKTGRPRPNRFHRYNH